MAVPTHEDVPLAACRGRRFSFAETFISPAKAVYRGAARENRCGSRANVRFEMGQVMNVTRMSDHGLKEIGTAKLEEAIGKAVSGLVGKEWSARVSTIDYGGWNNAFGAKATISLELTEEVEPSFLAGEKKG